jgi:hypothetical protein
MNNKHDQEFLVQAADTDLRSAAITAITRRRTVLIWTVGMVTLSLFIIGLTNRQPSIYLVLVCCIFWTLLYKSDSDLKLLQVIERLRRDEKPVA